MMPKILIPKILQPDRTLFLVVKVDQRGGYIEPALEVRDRDEPSILPSINPILDQDKRYISPESDPIVLSIGASFLDRMNIESPILVVRESLPGFENQRLQAQAHTKSCSSKTPCWTSRPATMQWVSVTPVRMIEFGQAIALRSFAALSIKELAPTQLSSLISAPGLTLALGSIRAGQSGSVKWAGRQPSPAMARWIRRYSARFPILNHWPSSTTAPPTWPLRPIQSTRTGINEVFLLAGIWAIAAGSHTQDFAKANPPGIPLFNICRTSTTSPARASKLTSVDNPVVRKANVTARPLEK